MDLLADFRASVAILRGGVVRRCYVFEEVWMDRGRGAHP